ncbi:MAG: hypothetical protein P8K78_06200 [Pirellulales bacterium]|nr:hypothetical protein [Pirellulales bacterium]
MSCPLPSGDQDGGRFEWDNVPQVPVFDLLSQQAANRFDQCAATDAGAV